ncbi:MAG TPA: response regulator [Verrucomicrobiota bacterium]|nr:DNA-binding response regulator [Verrucomicrobiales bacterium]HRI11962.1 response regulator [Verrucomicrobiota bacterium]
MKPNGVLIRVVDDDNSFRTAIARFLRASGFEVKAYAAAAEFLADPSVETPGCVLLDLEMPQLSGLDLQDALTKADIRLPVVFVSGQGDIPKTVLAMRRGAEDFLTKSCSREVLLEAIHRAVARDATERQTRARLHELQAKLEELTEREREVLRHVVQGRLNKQIAADLGIHERTVKLHRTHLTTKLEVRSVAELTRLVQEAGFR